MGEGTTAAGNIVLIGFMGSGKSEVGRRLAERTGRRFIDTDEIVESAGAPIADIFASEGEVGFRRREADAVRRASRASGAVIATGGGAVLSGDNVRRLRRNGVLVYLEVRPAELARRLESADDRPLLASEDDPAASRDDPKGRRDRRRRRIRRLLSERTPTYEAAADHVVACDGLDADGVCREVLGRLALGDGDGPIGRVEVRTSPPYGVRVGHGLLRKAAAALEVPSGAEKICIVTHPRVWRLWGGALAEGLEATGLEASHFTFPQGERHKTLHTAARLHRRLAAERFHRGDVLVGLGGGVVGDVTGFVASTYARGMPFVLVPTTLLAMVDAAVGGKTGVNLPEGKNLVGTFSQPRAVLCDLDTLTTLPDRELRGGLAEVVKYALIADPDLGGLLVDRTSDVFARGDVLEPLVTRSVEIKADVVAEDPRETGRRAILNYGHTLGHALEGLALEGRLAGVRSLHHGEAISVGMVFAAQVAVLCDLAPPDIVDEHLRLLEAVGLPTRTGPVAWDDVERYVAVDKKYARGLRLVLLEGSGKPVVRGGVPRDVLVEALDRVTGDG